jgi:Zn-dependent protease with chaperone function
MDFFSHQDRARGRTVKLFVLYGLAVLGVLAALNALAIVVYNGIDAEHASRARADRFARLEPESPPPPKGMNFWNPAVYGTTSAAVLVVIGLAGVVKQMQIGGDGGRVAEMLGGRLVSGNASDAAERKLMNVVEEMAIASGVPVPRVYLMENEQGINAFAAGTRPESAVVAVTRGCIRSLSRDELQGVVAHEFSHILNGDMRINLRMIALNFGIMAIGIIGYWVMRLGFESAGRSSKKEGAGAALGIGLVGLGLMIIGYVGVFFGNMVQAAVSRQREFLADASAVQFTRNSKGIAGALKKIGGAVFGSGIASPRAAEVSHMYFAKGAAGFMSGLFATHPPLEQRIRAIEPNWNGQFDTSVAVEASGDQHYAMPGQSAFASRMESIIPGAAAALNAPPPLPGAGTRVVFRPADVSTQVAIPQPEKLVHATTLLTAIPDAILEAARDSYSARAVALAMLINDAPQVQQTQMDMLSRIDPLLVRDVVAIYQQIAPLGPAVRVPLLDLANPALQSLSPTQAEDFAKLIEAMASADQLLSPFELALLKVVEKLAARQEKHRVDFASVTAAAGPAGVMLSVLARVGGGERAYAAGAARLQANNLPPMDVTATTVHLSDALEQLKHASPGVQRRLVDAAAHCIAADGAVRLEEAELLRAICAALGVPVPPYLRPA